MAALELIAETVLRSGEAEGIAQRGWLQRREANIEAEHGLNVTLASVAVTAGAGTAAGGATRTRPEDPGRRDGGVGVAVDLAAEAEGAGARADVFPWLSPGFE